MTAIIFDLDGTIINTNNLIIETLKQVAWDQCHVSLRPKEIEAMYGLTVTEQMKMINPDKVESLVDVYHKLYQMNMYEETKLFDGIKNLIIDLYQRDLSLFILTNNNQKDTLSNLNRFELRDYFKGIITMDDVKNGKPDPEGIEILLERFNLDRGEVLFIGDSPHDILTGANAKVKTVLVGWSYFKIEKFNNTYDYLVETPKDVVDLIE